jgi:hypothetical protein
MSIEEPNEEPNEIPNGEPNETFPSQNLNVIENQNLNFNNNQNMSEYPLYNNLSQRGISVDPPMRAMIDLVDDKKKEIKKREKLMLHKRAGEFVQKRNS